MATTFSVVTFGCQMNEHDSERVAGAMIQAGYEEADRDEADVVLFNTCCVRENAAQRLRGQVASLAYSKRERPEMVIGVLGCLAQGDGEALARDLPHVDLVVGPGRLDEVPLLVCEALDGRRGLVELGTGEEGFTADLPARRVSPSRAWVSIMQGCDNHCSYCIVPTARGPERSRPIEDVTGEVDALLKDGTLEVTLLGQNVNSYGRDVYGRPRFAELLRRLDGMGVPRLRFTTSHPKDFTDEVIEAIAGCAAVCEHVHLPAQSGSDRILDLMGRGYTGQWYRDRIKALRDACPDVAVSTDLMVGFPTESEADFADTLALVEEVGFSQAFTFVYSARADTPAAVMAGECDHDEVRVRMKALVEAVNRNAASFCDKLVGTTQEVLVEGPAKRGKGLVKGRSRGGQTVILDGTDALPDQIVKARMKEAHTWFLMGEVRSGDW